MPLLPEIEEFINKPTKDGYKKKVTTTQTYRSTINQIVRDLGVTEEQMVSGDYNEEKVVKTLTATNLSTSIKRKLAQRLQEMAGYFKYEKPLIHEKVSALIAAETIAAGEVRSKEEHDDSYVDTTNSKEIIASAIAEIDKRTSPSPLELMQLRALFLTSIIPLRPSEAVSIVINGAVGQNRLKDGLLIIEADKQKSKTVGERRIELESEFLDFLAMTTTTGDKGAYLFPSATHPNQPMSALNFTKQLIKPATERWLGKAVTSRDLRTSVISNKAPSMTPEERLVFAKECGHTLATQKASYTVFKRPEEKSFVYNREDKSALFEDASPDMADRVFKLFPDEQLELCNVDSRTSTLSVSFKVINLNPRQVTSLLRLSS